MISFFAYKLESKQVWKKIEAKIVISDLKRPLTKASGNLFSRIQIGLKLSALLTRGKGLQEINSHPMVSLEKRKEKEIPSIPSRCRTYHFPLNGQLLYLINN